MTHIAKASVTTPRAQGSINVAPVQKSTPTQTVVAPAEVPAPQAHQQVTGGVAAATPFGVWKGVDGRHGSATPRDSEIDVRSGKKLGELDVVIARRMDPAIHGTSLVASAPSTFADLIHHQDNSIDVDAFYKILNTRVPTDVLKNFDACIETSAALAKIGLAPPPPPADLFHRSLVQAYLHSIDIQTVMTGLGFPPNDAGNIVGGLAWVEKAVNFLQHHMPREHFGVRHLPRGEWANLEHALATDPAISHSEVGKAIARDAAVVWQQLELEGKVIPWQKLRRPEGANDAAIQRAFETLQGQNALGDRMYAKHDAALSVMLRALSPAVRAGVESLKKQLADPASMAAVRSGQLLPMFMGLKDLATTDGDKKAIAAAGELLAARSAQVSVVDHDVAARMAGVIAALEQALGHAEPQYFPLGELQRSIDTMSTLPDVIEESKKINDSVAAQVYGTWVDIWKKGFPFPNVQDGSLTGPAALVARDSPLDSKIQARLQVLATMSGSVEEKIRAAFPGVDPSVVLNDYIHVDPNAPAGSQVKVNVSALGPFGSAMVIWGDSREDANAIMDPHRLSPHHNGNSDETAEAPEVAGKHDLLEFAPLKDVQQQMKNKFFPAWIGNMAAVLETLGDVLLA